MRQLQNSPREANSMISKPMQFFAMGIIFLFLVLAPWNLFSVVRILTFHYNQADFIELQYKALQKFFVDDFEYIVFNDAATEENKNSIEEVCARYSIKCVRFEQEWHWSDPLNVYLKRRLLEPTTIGWWGWNAETTLEELAQHPSVRHCHVIQYALDNYGYEHDDIVAIMDGDNFLLRPLSLRQMFEKYDIVGFAHQCDHLGTLRKQSLASHPFGPDHAWEPSVVFIAFNPIKLPERHTLKFHVDVAIDHPHHLNHVIADSGAGAYRYLRKYPETKIKEFYFIDTYIFRSQFTQEELRGLGWSDALIQFMHDIAPYNVQFFMFEHFMHFSNVSFEAGGHKLKVMHLHKLFDALLNDSMTVINSKKEENACD
jgi:hypothetical protein